LAGPADATDAAAFGPTPQGPRAMVVVGHGFLFLLDTSCAREL